MGKNREVVSRILRPSEKIRMYSIGADLVHEPPSQEYVTDNIEALRWRIASLDASAHQDNKKAVTSINRYFLQNDRTMVARSLNHKLDEPIGKDIFEWLTHAPAGDIESFCKWSLVRTGHLTQALRRDQPKFISSTLNKTAGLIDTGLFPGTAMSVMEAATERYRLQGMDSFFSGGNHAMAFCGDDTIVMGNWYDSRKYMYFTSTDMKRTMLHEYIHGAGRDRGFFWGISTYVEVMRPLEEAFVEHATVVAHTTSNVKSAHIINPSKRTNLSYYTGVYRPERTFLAALVDHTNIKIEQIGEAYFFPLGIESWEFMREDI